MVNGRMNMDKFKMAGALPNDAATFSIRILGIMDFL
jgi:hypothetical protein